MTNTTTTPSPPVARSLHEICEDAGLVNCGECWAIPGDECVCTSVPVSVPGTPVQPARGYHVARFGRAMRRGLISGPDLIAVLGELIAVLGELDAFTNATVVYDIPDGCAVSPQGSPSADQSLGDEPWARTPDRSVWRAHKGGLVLTVTRLADGTGWTATAESPEVTERSAVPLPTRLAAQRWADSRAGGAR